jgi:hypothetical protein
LLEVIGKTFLKTIFYCHVAKVDSTGSPCGAFLQQFITYTSKDSCQ